MKSHCVGKWISKSSIRIRVRPSFATIASHAAVLRAQCRLVSVLRLVFVRVSQAKPGFSDLQRAKRQFAAARF